MLMNAAPRSVVPAQRRRSRRPDPNSRVTRSRAAVPSTVTSMPSRTVGQKGEKLNIEAQRLGTATLSRQTTPAWLSSLVFLQRSSDYLTFLLIGATLTLYSWTVYTQQQWTQEYRKLETLQRNERNLTTANEVMKDQLAQQAESPATGLVTPTSANAIFLPPAPQRQSHTAPTQKTDAEPTATTPLGY